MNDEIKKFEKEFNALKTEAAPLEKRLQEIQYRLAEINIIVKYLNSKNGE